MKNLSLKVVIQHKSYSWDIRIFSRLFFWGRHQVHARRPSSTLSFAEAPAGYPNKNSKNGKIPSHRAPHASFFLPSLPTWKKRPLRRRGLQAEKQNILMATQQESTMFYYSLFKHWIKVCGPLWKSTSDWFQTFTAVLDNTRHPMSKTSLDFRFSATSIKIWRLGAFSADLLGNRRLLQRVQKVMICDLWLVDFASFCVFLSVSRFGCLHVLALKFFYLLTGTS